MCKAWTMAAAGVAAPTRRRLPPPPRDGPSAVATALHIERIHRTALFMLFDETRSSAHERQAVGTEETQRKAAALRMYLRPVEVGEVGAGARPPHVEEQPKPGPQRRRRPWGAAGR